MEKMEYSALDSPIEISNNQLLHEIQKHWREEESSKLSDRLSDGGLFVIASGFSMFFSGLAFWSSNHLVASILSVLDTPWAEQY